MAFTLEKMENNKVKLEITVEEQKYQKSLGMTLKKLGNQANIPGFRKGKAPRHMLERYWGKDYIENEAAQPLMGPACFEALNEADLDPISTPKVDIVQVGDGKDLIFTAEVQLPPEVELGAYLDLPIETKPAEVTDQQVDEEIRKRQEAHAKIITLEEGMAAENGDNVNIDFTGYKDGEAFDGGSAERYDLLLGSQMFIPGFEEQLVGVKVGETVDINVTFPEDYKAEALKGQPVVFKVTVNSIKRKELVPLDDEFAKDVSEFDTLDEYREDIKATLLKNLEDRLEQERKASIISTVVDNAVVEPPDSMVLARCDSMLNDLQNNLARQGISLAQYCQFLGIDPQTFQNDMRTKAEGAVKTDMVLDAIAQKEKITCTDEDLLAEIEKMADKNKRSAEEILQLLEAQGEKRNFKKTINRERVINFLTDFTRQQQ